MEKIKNNAPIVSIHEFTKDTNLNTRDQAVDLFLFIETTNSLKQILAKEKEIVFDFASIEFVSRSFVDEFFKRADSIQITVKYINLTDFLKSTLETVSKTYKIERKNHSYYQHKVHLTENLRLLLNKLPEPLVFHKFYGQPFPNELTNKTKIITSFSNMEVLKKHLNELSAKEKVL